MGNPPIRIREHKIRHGKAHIHRDGWSHEGNEVSNHNSPKINYVFRVGGMIYFSLLQHEILKRI
jgi:hypothetical protein